VIVLLIKQDIFLFPLRLEPWAFNFPLAPLALSLFFFPLLLPADIIGIGITALL
jgi:hypothetical protein